MPETQLVGVFSLFVLMMIVGLELTPADFRRVLASPATVVGGTAAQLILLPLMTWAIVVLLDVPPVFGAGAILVAASPGAGMSNILTALARANTALSVTLTAVASLLSVVTLPALAALGIRLFLGDRIEVDVPVGPLMLQLSLALLLPIGLGMWLRARRPDLAHRYAPRLQRWGIAGLVLLVVLAVAFSEEEQFPVDWGDAGIGLLAAGVWTLAAMGIGWGVAFALRLPAVDRFTFLIEFSARNVAVASIVALSGLERLDLTFFGGVYVAIGYPLAVAAAVVWRRRRPAAVTASP
jgi:BASS family bile acid:Na+ symporter